MTPLLDIQNLVVDFKGESGPTRAVDHVSFSVGRCETVGVVGESGSGKSVTSLSIMRLISEPPGRISEGSITFHESDGSSVNLLSLPPGKMRTYRGKRIGMIFQEPMTSLNPVFTCGDQVMEALLQHETKDKKEAKKRTLALFEKVKLPRPETIFDSYPHQISGGQKQRVMIAMAISCKPDLLIADEPTTALDVTVQKTILSLIKELQTEMGMGVIFITHDLGVVKDIADKVIVMYRGKIMEQGATSVLFERPQHPYTKGLLACRPPLTQRLNKLPTVADFMKVVQGIPEETGLDLQAVYRDWAEKPSGREAQQKKIYGQKPLLEIQDLNTWFPVNKSFWGKPKEWVKAVNGVNFNVYPGETLGLVGESGCGKTTLGRTLLKLQKAHSGKVLYEGNSILEMSDSEIRPLRKDLQIIFQDPYSSLNPRMTIGKAIEEPMHVHRLHEKRLRRDKVVELLERVGLGAEHYGRYPHEFSGGQRQRVGIARALAVEPRFIVCDESVSALDVSVQAQVLNLLNDLKQDFGLTYIFISHDLSVVKHMSDRMIVMNKGVIEEYGDAEEVYQNPKSAYTKSLIEAIPGV